MPSGSPPPAGLARAWSRERVVYRDALFCVVDKPAGVSCDAAAPPDEWSLSRRLEAFGLGATRCVQSTPVRASGATLLGFEPSGGAAAVAALTCVVAVDDWRGPARGRLRLSERAGGAELECRVLRRHGARTLLELEGRVTPESLVAALRREGQPVVGDDAAGASDATRLMLHVSELRGPVVARVPLPAEFESWLGGAAAPPPERFPEAFESALVSRHGLLEEFEALRLIGEESGEIAGIGVERYGEYAVLYVSSEAAAQQESPIAECLMDHGFRGVYVKRRVRADLRGVDPESLAPSLPLRGSPAPALLPVRQGAVTFLVSLADGLATGLFLDQRANWARVGRLASGRSFLNLFCYTGAFTLFAAAGRASATTSVDLAGRALSRLAENLERNALAGQQHRLLKSDVPSWLARAARGQRRFGCMVLDPPSFGTRARGVLSTRRDQPELLDAALAVLEPGGALLVVSHHRKISAGDLLAQVAESCTRAGREARLQPLAGGWDCPTLPGVSHTKSVLAQLA